MPCSASGSRPPPAPVNEPCCSSLLGKVAIANAKQTYQRYQELFRGARWQALAR